jgi:hypothetical protein
LVVGLTPRSPHDPLSPLAPLSPHEPPPPYEPLPHQPHRVIIRLSREKSMEHLLHLTLVNEERANLGRLHLAAFHLARAAGLNHNDPRKVALFTSCMEAVTLLNQKYSKK